MQNFLSGGRFWEICGEGKEVGVALTVDESSTSVMSYPLSATTNSTALTSSKQPIHFLLSVRWPPTSYSLRRNPGREKDASLGNAAGRN